MAVRGMVACRTSGGVLASCREAFDHVVDRSLALVAFLKAQGPAAVHNMDNLLLMESMDVIGMSLGLCLTLVHSCERCRRAWDF